MSSLQAVEPAGCDTCRLLRHLKVLASLQTWALSTPLSERLVQCTPCAITHSTASLPHPQVALESLQPGDGLDYSLLEGKWRLVYTTAADVVPIVGLDLSTLLPAGLPAPVVVGDVFQRFSSVEEGRVENIIEFGLPPLTEGKRGVTFTVGAR